MPRPHPLVWLRDHPRQADALLAGALAMAAIGGEWASGGRTNAAHWRQPDALSVVLLLALTVPLAWRRKHPATTLALVGLASVAFNAAGYQPDAGGLPMVVAFYSAAVHRTRPTAAGPAAFVLVTVVLDLAVSQGQGIISTVAGHVVIYSITWIVADNLRNRRANAAALRSRAERLEHEREAEARQAVSDERARIARELHDVVAHSMSVMVVQAGAARRILARDPEGARDALASIEQTGRQALEEMRRMLGVLRSDDFAADRAPQPTVGELQALLDTVREAGLDVSYIVQGEPRPLASGIDLSVFRIVQEALTNTLKHARARHVDVFLRWRQDELEVEVSDDGRGPTTGDADGPGGDSGGHGLVGMRERMALYGGELVVGRRPGGGFRVQARVPLDGVAGAPGVARPPGVAGAPGVARPPGVPGAAGAPAHR